MIKTKPLWKFFGYCCGIYLLLLAVFSTAPMMKTSATLFRATTLPFLETLYPKVLLRLDKTKNPNVLILSFVSQTAVEEQRQILRKNGGKSASVDLQGYEHKLFLKEFFLMPLLFLLALILATPIRLFRKLKAIGLGIVIFYIFTLLNLINWALFCIASHQLGAYELSATQMQIVIWLDNLTKLAAPTFFCILIWALVCFNKQDFQKQFSTRKSSKKNK